MGLPKQPSGCATASGAGSLGGPFSTVRATAVGRGVEPDAERNTVLAGNPKEGWSEDSAMDWKT